MIVVEARAQNIDLFMLGEFCFLSRDSKMSIVFLLPGEKENNQEESLYLRAA